MEVEDSIGSSAREFILKVLGFRVRVVFGASCLRLLFVRCVWFLWERGRDCGGFFFRSLVYVIFEGGLVFVFREMSRGRIKFFF